MFLNNCLLKCFFFCNNLYIVGLVDFFLIYKSLCFPAKLIYLKKITKCKKKRKKSKTKLYNSSY